MFTKEGPFRQNSSKVEREGAKIKFDKFMFEHGDKVGNIATLSRVPGAIIVAGLILTDHPRAAQAAHASFSITDGVDGWAKRKSKVGPSKKWGSLDQGIDKFFSTVVEGAMVKKGHLSSGHFKARGAREIVMSFGVRPRYVRQGIDTSAVISGKVSTMAATIADNFALSKSARNNSKFDKFVQGVATGAKIYSLFDAPKKWARKERPTTRFE